MLLNPYAVLDLALSLLRLALALMVVILGMRAWRQSGRALGEEARREFDEQSWLVSLLGFVLLGLGVLSWPLLYLLLQSYVPQWPGVMCIYGVMRIGSDSSGPSRFLPSLLTFLELVKPALVFGAGGWFALYLVNRRTATAPLLRQLLAALVALGMLAGGDALAEIGYLLIPKHEEHLSAGCCTAVVDDPSHGTWLSSDAVVGLDDRPLLSLAYALANLGIVIGLHVAARRAARPGRAAVALLLGGTVGTFLVSNLFLAEVAAPILLRLPYHHCPYDLFPAQPELLLAAALFLLASFAVGWAWLVQTCGTCEGSAPFIHGHVKVLLRGAWFGYFGSFVMIAVALLVS